MSAALPSGTLRPHVLVGGYALQCANQAAISDGGHADKPGWGTPSPCNPLDSTCLMAGAVPVCYLLLLLAFSIDFGRCAFEGARNSV